MRKASLNICIFIGIAMCGHVSPAFAQEGASKPLMLSTFFGPGAIALPSGKDWEPELLTVYDNGVRPVAQFKQISTGINASFIVFQNLSGNPTAEGCRSDVIGPIVKNEGALASKREDSELKSSSGEALAATSFLLDMGVAGAPHQRNLYGFAGNAKTCLEIHLSSVTAPPADEDAMKALLAGFSPDLTFQPGAGDYFRLATILFKSAPGLAVPYYKSSLAALPDSPQSLTPRRVITDQLVMALGMSGDLKSSRALAEQAVKADPDYPLNYYNLACADAEQGNAADAKAHLQQAFDRRANTLKGESLPDPATDDSILKLKHNKEFWAFVLALPKG
jgi:hypothetical protein